MSSGGQSGSNRSGADNYEGVTLWGIHMGAAMGTRPIDEAFIALGWAEMGDLAKLEATREAFKAKMTEVYPDKKPGAIPVDAGTLYRFVHEMKPGDLVVYPSKRDRMVNIGRVTGPYEFHPESVAEEDQDIWATSRRAVEWLAHVPRTTFSQGALHEIGSFITLFQVTTHAEEFLAPLRGQPVRLQSEAESDADTEAASEQVEETTEDFVIRRLKTGVSPEQFEHFVAGVLTAMGYFSRVTQYSQDGGIDIIAHRDELGFEPPVIKVQCKQVETNIGAPDVHQLVGAVAQEEFGLFVTLGGYSREALAVERSRANIRLIDGNALVGLIFRHYDHLDSQWKTVLPLKRAYIPGPLKRES